MLRTDAILNFLLGQAAPAWTTCDNYFSALMAPTYPNRIYQHAAQTDRLSDSLLFTGFSVPLLDYVVKTMVLERGFGITAATHPAQLYSTIACVNGAYIALHNTWRGLSRFAALGNLFRTVLSIPIAVALNAAIGAILGAAGVAGPAAVLQKWAAIISKFSSDCVAGVIEGLADRRANVRVRMRDYTAKLRQLFAIHARLELLYPDTDALEMLQSPKQLIRKIDAEGRDLEKVLIVNALDLFYFWMYQPRARTALGQFVQTLSEDERHILASSQFTLQRHREISQMFIDGILGSSFPRPLSFYLSRHAEYLEAIKSLVFGENFADLTEDPTSSPPAMIPGQPSVKECTRPSSTSTAN